jgi:membrane protein DedA with SNARE-associated domain
MYTVRIMMASIEHSVLSLAQTLPLELFVIIVSFLEEVIAPIPSPSVMVIAGSFGLVQGYSYVGLALLVFLASIGKTLGGLTMYWIASKLKDVGLTFFGKFIDVTQDDIDRFGSKFTGSPRDYFIYIFFRSVPIIPSILLSFGSGIIRLPLRLFIVGTFVGTLVRDTFYIVVGYAGTDVLMRYLASTAQAESLMQLLIVGFFGVFLLSVLIRRRRRRA